MKPIVFKGSAVALVTPMHSDLSVNYEKLGELLDFHLNNGTDAVVIAGTTGESATLTDEEHLGVIDYTVRRVGHKIPVTAGVRRVIASHAGALLHVTPYYNKASQKGLYLHFKACAEASSLPVILYNVPSRTGVNIMADTYRKLSEIDNIVATKEASGNFSQIAKISSLCGDNLRIYSGNDDQITSALALGALGVISVLANIVPRETHDICESFFSGDPGRSDSLQLQYLELIENLFSDVNPIPVKHAMNALGFDVGGCRLPLCDMDEVAAERLLACLKRYGMLEDGHKVGSVTVRRPQNTFFWIKTH